MDVVSRKHIFNQTAVSLKIYIHVALRGGKYWMYGKSGAIQMVKERIPYPVNGLFLN